LFFLASSFLVLLELLDIDKLLVGGVDLVHLFDLVPQLVFHISHHHPLLLHRLLFLEVLLEIVGNSCRVFAVFLVYQTLEHFLLSNNALSELVELNCTVSDLLMHALWLSNEVLAVR